MHDPEISREFAVDVVRSLTDAGFQALWAGGCVRDLLRGTSPKDYDVASSARPDEVRNLFGRGQTLAVGESFGVILVRGPRGAADVEVAMFRTEGPYSDGRRPDQIAFATPEEDARRRDFTINGMFYDPLEQEVYDYVGGKDDLAAGVLRAIGDPAARMTEDKLRMLRAVRFAAVMEFEIDEATANAVRRMAEEIHVVSPERIAQELTRMLLDEHRRRAMELAMDLGLLCEVLPELDSIAPTHDNGSSGDDEPGPWARTLQALHLLEAPGLELAFAALLHEAVDSESARRVCRRLRLSNRETELVGWLLDHASDIAAAPKMKPSTLKRMLSHANVGEQLALARVLRLVNGRDLHPVLFCEQYLRDTPPEQLNPPPLLTGDILISHGHKPGPEFKPLLDAVRDAQLNGEISNEAEALELVARLQNEDDLD